MALEVSLSSTISKFLEGKNSLLFTIVYPESKAKWTHNKDLLHSAGMHTWTTEFFK